MSADTPPPPLAVAAVLLFSPAPDRLARFYREVLGIPLSRVAVPNLDPHWACDIGHVYVSVWPKPDDAPADQPGRAGLALYVKEIYSEFDRVSAHDGVTVLFRPTKTLMGTIARLRDPDGNPFELYHP